MPHGEKWALRSDWRCPWVRLGSPDLPSAKRGLARFRTNRACPPFARGGRYVWRSAWVRLGSPDLRWVDLNGRIRLNQQKASLWPSEKRAECPVPGIEPRGSRRFATDPFSPAGDRQDMASETRKEQRDSGTRGWQKLFLLGLLAAVIIIGYTQFRETLTLANLAEQETRLREFQTQYPLLVFGSAFVLYVVVTGLSLPGATPLSLLYGWYFRLVPGVVLVSFASTAGATLAFALSRFLFRDFVQRRFGQRLERIQAAWEREGAYYLFTLRLIPAIPFFVINAVMGLTTIRARTFWWVSQLGMLPATIVYVFAGSSVPSLRTLADEGLRAVFTPRQLTQLLVAFILLGLFPLVVRQIVKWVGRGTANPDAVTEKS